MINRGWVDMKFKNINATYKDKQIYENVSVDFERVGMTFIKGDSGSGKTTLLNILYGLKTFEGDYLVEGEVNDFIRNNMAYIFQDFKIDTNLTVYENIILQLNIKDIEIDENSINDLLNDFDMLGNKYKKAKVLSGGEKQRLAIIRALVTKPAILLCDEPTGNLDEDKSFEIFDLLKEISKTKLVLVVSHNEILIEKYSDVVYEIIDKQLVTVKDTNLNDLNYGDSEYGKISRRDLLNKSFNNFKIDLFKKLSMFIVFSLLASLFLVLNFSKESNSNYLAEKYSDFEGKDTIYVEFNELKSINNFNDFASDMGFDGYILDSITIDLANGDTVYVTNADFPIAGYIDIMPKFINQNILNKYKAKYANKCIRFYRVCSDDMYKEFNINSYPIVIVSDFKNLEPSLISGRLPENDEEVLLSIELLIRVINAYNNLIIENELDEEILNYEEMSIEDINVFLLTNNVLLKRLSGYEVNMKGAYSKDTLDGINYDVVGVVDDKYYSFDPNIYYNTDRVSKAEIQIQSVYVSEQLFLRETKLQSPYFINRQKQKQNPFVPNSIDVQDVFNDNFLDLKELKLFYIVAFHKNDMDIYEYIDFISRIEESQDVKEVIVDAMFESYNLDLQNIKRIHNQINIYSAFILLIAFLTAFIPYYLMVKNRSGEFFMYKILGMGKMDRLNLYLYEFVFTLVALTLMIFISYIGVVIYFEDSLCELFSTLIFSTRIDNLELNFRINEIVVLGLVFLPFLFSYKFLSIKKG